MPNPAQRQPDLQHAPLSVAQPFASSNTEVLLAVRALEVKLDHLHALLAPPRSALTLDPDEIARTMAQLRHARPLPKETPP
nr:hypothetical protein [uncultured Duganella sp.]